MYLRKRKCAVKGENQEFKRIRSSRTMRGRIKGIVICCGGEEGGRAGVAGIEHSLG